ncbi:MAG: UDP-N-acetylmuramate dehydrogenase [Aquificae bacterium]|nr:UDP-N-acetylmuramate dehydrogenase [Aquificota bacterium]
MKSVDYEEYVDLSKLCTIKIGGKAKKVYFPKSLQEVQDLVKLSLDSGKRLIPIGIGSNTVFKDGLLDYLFVSSRALKKVDINQEGDYFLITAQAGVSFKTIVSIVKKYNLEGFENLSGIPSTVGGAVVMNAGAFGSEIGDIIQNVVWVDGRGQVRELKREEIQFGYRKSPFQNGGFVYSATLKLKKSSKNIPQIIKKLLQERNKKQPLNYPTSGSTYKNPKEKPAGYLLESVGLKGYRIGDVAFSGKHANFLVNLGNGRYAHLKRILEEAENRVKQNWNITLEREVRIVE